MDVAVRLKDIDERNWMEITLLSTREDGKAMVCEEYVASNAFSICQALFEETWEFKGIYCGKTPIGFVMYGYNNERRCYELCRLMIDYPHQGKGFGRIALKLALEEMLEYEDCEEIYVAVNEKNERAKQLYRSVGFEDTGQRSGQEEIYCLHIADE